MRVEDSSGVGGGEVVAGLCVIIPSKTSSNLRPCTEAVRQHEPTARILVIDDGLDAVPCWVDDIIPGVKPFIFSRAMNSGIRAGLEVGAESFVLLNDDALLKTPNGFTAMQRAAEERPDFGIIGSTTNVTGQPLQRPMGQGLREVPHFAFVCVLIPRRTINQVGLLDERYCIDYGVEDRDYCEAVTRAGLKVGVHDDCYVDHGSLWSTFRGDPHTPKSYEKNLQLFREKWGILV